MAIENAIIAAAVGMAKGVLIDAKNSAFGTAKEAMKDIEWISCASPYSGRPVGKAFDREYERYDHAFKKLQMVGYLSREDERELIVTAKSRVHTRLIWRRKTRKAT